MDGEAGHTQHSAAEEKNRAAAVAPGQAQERQARSLAQDEKEGVAGAAVATLNWRR